MTGSIRFQEFADFFSKLRTALVSLPALVPLVNLTGSVGPIWLPPAATSMVLSLFNLVVMIVTFLLLAGKTQKVIGRWLLWVGIPIFLFSVLVYLYILAFHTFDAPDFEHREVGGLFYTKKALDYLAVKPGTCPKDLIADMGNNADEVWTTGSLQFMRVAVLISWSLIFLSLEFMVMTFALIQFKKRGRTQIKK
jgi:hypothetical protein